MPTATTSPSSITSSPSHIALSDVPSNSRPGSAQASVELPITTADYPFDDYDGEADTVLRSSDNVDFFVHKPILVFSSDVIRGWYREIGEYEKRTILSDAPNGFDFAFSVDEDSSTLALLLQFVYPGNGEVLNLNDFQTVMAPMIKYEMTAHIRILRRFLITPAILETQPLRVFAIAYRFGFEDEARRAARQCLYSKLVPQPEIKELEHVSALQFHRLWTYHRDCGMAAAALTTNFTWMDEQPWVWLESAFVPVPVPTITVPSAEFQASFSSSHQEKKKTHSPDCHLHPLTWYSQGKKRHLVRSWFIDFMEDARLVLQEQPLGAVASVLSSPEFLDPTLVKAQACEVCRPKAYLDLTSFITRFFTKEIESVVDTIKHDLTLQTTYEELSC